MKPSPPPPAPLSVRDWTTLCAVAAVVALIFLRVVTWHLAAEAAVGVHLTPRAERLIRAGLIAAPLLPVLVLVGMTLLRRPARRLVLSLVGLTLLGALGSGGYLYWTFELFEAQYQRTLPAPDPEHEAFLYSGGLLGCRVVVYVAERRAMWGREVASRTVDCTEPYDAAWLPDGGVEIRGAPPKPLFGR
ncbi:MAG: hypothetical protein AB1730_07710 [Myxococcota bacterium]